MKYYKTLLAMASLLLIATSVQANNSGLTYDSCENYYSTYYGIDMSVTSVDAPKSVTTWEPQPTTAIEASFYSDP
ncbi:MAG: hypothetical protein U9Q75_05365, partial [Pseudomonadota bacterium]|nr:hypothetical protein [Pseudomonadota bacterium]